VPSVTDTQTKPSPLARQVVRAVQRARLFQAGDRLLIAVSGGPDSVALLSILTELASSWRLTLHALHVNYGLRGEESEEDARFVARLCDRFGIPCRCERVSLGQPGPDGHRSSLQARARDARYDILARMARALGANKVALGHQADDQAETLLMWMLRGAGSAGLSGIPPVRESLFIRPLLGISREAILAYLRTRALPFRLDSSNTKPIYMRNRIRHELLPVMKQFNPAIVEVLARQSEVLREEDTFLGQAAVDALAPLAQKFGDDGALIDRASFLALPLALQRRALRLLLHRANPALKGPSFKGIASLLDQVCHGRPGASLTIQNVVVTSEYDVIRFAPLSPSDTSPASAGERGVSSEVGLPLPIPSTVDWPLTGQKIRVSLGKPHQSAGSSHSPKSVTLDRDRFSMPLTVRAWLPGDAFQPTGMQGRTKKLQDYFSDIKLPRRARKLIPLVLAPEGILWVAGHRADHRFCARSGTNRTLRIELLETSEGGTD